ncbi:MAG: pentapeptide repeat-containing protein [Mastigocoleus sp.]
MNIQKSDFSHLGYHIKNELGRNRFGGRITYLAEVEDSKNQVVIKEFRFADVDTNWSGFKAYEREIEVLKQLTHPHIPKYLTSFETPQGFGLVQEYKDAPSLAVENHFNSQQVRQIAISILEILTYLQQRTPQIIHRDIKPENILVDKNLNAYLVDFGFAKVRNGEIALSSVASGTPGFIPPEEYFGRDLTEASDLYSLGVTLMCLLTNTRSFEVSQLINDDYSFNFKSLQSWLNPEFIDWLRKMVEPNIKYRFANAAAALEALEDISFTLKSSPVKVPTKQLTLTQGLTILGLISVSVTGIQEIEEISAYKEQQQQKLAIQQQQIRRQETDIYRLLRKQKQLENRINLLNRRVNRKTFQSFVNYNLSNKIAKLQTSKECNYCNLQKANLTNSQLKGASLKNVNLKFSNLVNANLENSNLTNANLKYSNLENIKFNNANLQNANLNRAKLRNAVLQNVNLSNANLMYAKLYNADLRNADLRGAKLRRIKLSGADLRGANLKYTNLDGVDLSNVKLEGAIMPDGHKHR